MRKLIGLLVPLVALLLLGGGIWYIAAAASGEGETHRLLDVPSTVSAVTVSGTVNGPGGGVPGVVVHIFSAASGWQQEVTDASGFYSSSVIPGGPIDFKVRPPLATHLTQANYRAENVETNYTRNFTVSAGSLASVLPVARGEPVTTGLLLDLFPLHNELPDLWWLELEWDTTSQRFQAVLPQDVVYLKISRVPAGYYSTFLPLDLRGGDVAEDIPLNTQYVPMPPLEPPDASKITLGAPNELGEVDVTGAPGSVMPLAHVFLNNLNSLHQAHAYSEADGSFAARIFAPMGSSILIKHGPADHGPDEGWNWYGLKRGLPGGKVTLIPGTILYVRPEIPAEPGDLPFATTGAAQQYVDLVEDTRDYVGAAWTLQGVVHPVDPGTFQVSGTLRLLSHAITPSTDLEQIHVPASVDLVMQHDATGQPVAMKNRFMSTLLSPSGLPIELMSNPVVPLELPIEFGNWRHVGDHAIEGDVSFTLAVADAPPGIYRPIVRFSQFESGQTGVPTDTTWLASNVSAFTSRFDEALLPPVRIGDVEPPRLIWRLLTNNWVQGQRGIGSAEDRNHFGLVTEIVTQGDVYHVPPVDERNGEPIVYRLEPFLPMISYADRKQPGPPLIPFDLPGGELHVTVRKPDGQVVDLGVEPFVQSLSQTPSTRAGHDHNKGTQQPDDFYGLQVASDRFEFVFDQYGRHIIEMTGIIGDIWGNTYTGGGTYEVWVAHSLDIDPGVLPGTPLAVDDIFNPTIQVYPRVPAEVELQVGHFVGWEPPQVTTQTATGEANAFGTFSPEGSPIALAEPGEYRVDLTAKYQDPEGRLYMGAMTWGGVVMTPPGQAELIAHGRRGYDVGEHPELTWFVGTRDIVLPDGAISHIHAPYFRGDIIWSRFEDGLYGDSLILNAGLEDATGGYWDSLLWERANRMKFEHMPPDDLQTRFDRGEIPVFFSTESGRSPLIDPGGLEQISYAYQSSQRPGVRVREYLAEDSVLAYWRLDTTYDDQLGDGVAGDIQNDYKLQYLGVVFHDLPSGHSEYLGYGSSWVFLPDDDPLGSRVMPPFSGPGNGGWTTEGGPIMTLKGEQIHIFILPTGVQPGAVLAVGDTFRFAGHINPTLDSEVEIVVTAPSGAEHIGGGQANSVGYFYDQSDDFVVDEPGLWSVDVEVWHDGACSAGTTIPPYPRGGVLGSEGGRYWFYVVPGDVPKLIVATPQPGYLHFGGKVTAITISGQVPPGLRGATVDYTIQMPGFILEHGQVTPQGGTYQILFDPATLAQDFPNLDLTNREENVPGLSDTISISLLLSGQRGEESVYRANTITLQAQQVYVDSPPAVEGSTTVYLPLVTRKLD